MTSSGNPRLERRAVQTSQAPNAVGPYSQAIIIGDMVYCAGQVPLDPATGQLIEGGIEDQTRRVLNNLKAVIEAAGSSMDRVVKTTVFLTTMDNFTAMNGVYGEFFSSPPPARSTVAIAGLPRGALLEIEAIAAL